MKIFKYEELDTADLIIDAVYEGGNNNNTSDDPLNKLLSVGVQGGFRWRGSIRSNIDFLVLYTRVWKMRTGLTILIPKQVN